MTNRAGSNLPGEACSPEGMLAECQQRVNPGVEGIAFFQHPSPFDSLFRADSFWRAAVSPLRNPRRAIRPFPAQGGRRPGNLHGAGHLVCLAKGRAFAGNAHPGYALSLRVPTQTEIPVAYH